MKVPSIVANIRLRFRSICCTSSDICCRELRDWLLRGTDISMPSPDTLRVKSCNRRDLFVIGREVSIRYTSPSGTAILSDSRAIRTIFSNPGSVGFSSFPALSVSKAYCRSFFFSVFKNTFSEISVFETIAIEILAMVNAIPRLVGKSNITEGCRHPFTIDFSPPPVGCRSHLSRVLYNIYARVRTDTTRERSAGW